ncbi:MAG: hypothetical protein ACUVXA_13700 [Candidatus Jordarchaeum sp.]|uniref:hypothetical protein n=1 Tax=Candidatus Jordarchaeum sp. TaxID=2823881 RepID=UPI00404AD1F4
MGRTRSSIPSGQQILREALSADPNLDVNALHAKTFELMLRYRSEYYERRVDEILLELKLPKDIRLNVKKKLLEPIVVGDKEYSNFMEEVSRRVSQAFQPLSGNLAELCVQRELEKSGLEKDHHFVKRKERTDFIIFHSDIQSCISKHRVEVKNVSLRERGTRGLAFDGDSLFGFFNQASEFTESNIQVLENLCVKTSGYCYVPPDLLTQIRYKTKRFKLNTLFGRDMAQFVKTGKIP